MKELLIIFTLAVFITFIILFSAGVFNNQKSSNSTIMNTKGSNKPIVKDLDDPTKDFRKKYGISSNDTYIIPAEFKIGLIKQNKHEFMNNCNLNVLYPINGLGPDYGWNIPKNCRCTEFIQAP